MPKKQTKQKHQSRSILGFLARFYKSLGLAHKVYFWFFTAFVALFCITYASSVYYEYKHRNDPLKIGVTFIPNYARYFGLDPQETYDAIVDDLGVDRLRLVSYWSDIEKQQGTYDYSELDWQFKKAEENNIEVSLAIGLRQPRWPECHMPDWAHDMPKKQWQPELYDFIATTVKRYKDSPVLDSYQLENEYFLKVFGECKDHSRKRLQEEFDLVKSIDPDTTLIVSRSNNAWGVPIRGPVPDQYALSIYKRVWDKTVTKKYFEYPFPAWYYSAFGGYSELLYGKSMIVHELQTEAWLPEGDYEMNRVEDIPEMEKSLNAERLERRIQFGLDSGIKTIDLWGAEWWYWQKEKANKPDLWNTAKHKIHEAKRSN